MTSSGMPGIVKARVRCSLTLSAVFATLCHAQRHGARTVFDVAAVVSAAAALVNAIGAVV
jgi:hypothetical protein